MSLRATTGVVMLLLASLFSDVRLSKPLDELLKKVIGVEEVALDSKHAYLSRIRELKLGLPRYGLVGYVTDDPQSFERYALTQYGLAPLILERNGSCPYVVGSFRDASLVQEIVQREHLHRLKDFGDGLVLLSGQERP